MWQDADSELRHELAPEEKLIWSGQPRQGIFLRGSDAFLIPFSLMWGGFAIFWEVMAAGALLATEERPPMGIGIIFPLFGLPFVLVGLYLILGRFFVDARQRAKTFYGLTNERAVIVSGLLGRKVKSLNLRTLTDISLSEKAGGRGTISFGPAHPLASWLGGSSWPGGGMYAPPSFQEIQDAKKVYDMIREAQHKAT